MTEIIGVRFKSGGKEYYFNPNGMTFQPGQRVIIETARGVEFGECTQTNSLVDEMTLISPLRPVLRAATAEDFRTVELNRKKEARAFEICEKKIAERKLDMKLVEVEYNFEGSKILFFFTSEGRVDFRELVKDLASVFHTRIELRQIGVRDEAKMLGGLGICGRPFCCSAFLDDFQPVSIKMAKTQSLSLNPTKISGSCGRLMCCLKYEQDAYEDALKRCPKNESLVETPAGVGTVCQVNLLREQARVRLDRSSEAPQTFPCDQLKVIRSGKGKRPEGYELPEPQERKPAGLRRNAPSTGKQNVNLPAQNGAPAAPAAPSTPAAEQPRPNSKRRGAPRKSREEYFQEMDGRDQGSAAAPEQSSTPVSAPAAPAEKPAPSAPQQSRREGGQPRKQSRRPNGNRPKATGEKASANDKAAQGEKPAPNPQEKQDKQEKRSGEGQKRNPNRRNRPRRRSGKPKGEGGAPTPPKAE